MTGKIAKALATIHRSLYAILDGAAGSLSAAMASGLMLLLLYGLVRAAVELAFGILLPNPFAIDFPNPRYLLLGEFDWRR